MGDDEAVYRAVEVLFGVFRPDVATVQRVCGHYDDIGPQRVKDALYRLQAAGRVDLTECSVGPVRVVMTETTRPADGDNDE